MTKVFLLLTLLSSSLYIACTKEAPKSEPATVASKAEEGDKKALVELGKYLFFDERLSADNSISCNSCHDVTNKKGGVDNLATSTGIKGQKGGRNAPTVWNAKFLSTQFWDGRAKDLAEQAKGPITNPTRIRGLAASKVSNF